MAEKGPINLPGFENINSLLRSVNLPYHLVAGTGRKTRDALDPSLPMEERIRKGGEAAIETGIQAALPFAGRMAGQPLSRAVVESFFPVSTPKSAAEVAVDTVEDMGRRNMLKGAAATTGVAALAPEVFIEASKKVPAAVTKTAARAAAVSPINMAAKNIRLLKKQIDKADALRDEIIDQVGEGAEASAQQATIYNTQDEIFDVVRDTLEEMEPEDYVQASDEALEELAKYNYDLGNQYGGTDYYGMDMSEFNDLAQEAKKRGLHKVKNEQGYDEFPSIRSLVEELDEYNLETSKMLQNMTLPNTALKMTDDSGKSTEQLIKELTDDAFKSQYEFVKKQLEETTDFSPEKIDRIARKNAGRSGRNKADGGEVHKGVGSLSEIARNMNQGGEASLDAEVESLIPAVILAESNNDPRAVSRDGAIGLMQILPQTAMQPGYGVPNIFDIARSQGFDVPEESEEVAKRLLFSPDLNVEFGVKYLKAMRRNFDTMEDALRAYNTGPGNFNKYLMGGRDLSLLDQEAIDYPIKVAAANQGINPNEPADFARFSNSPEAFSTFMQTASEERPMRVPRPKQRPLLSETLFAAPAQPAPQRQEDLKQEIEKTVGDVVNRESLQQKYSPEGIEKMLIGTIGESLLPRLFQRGSP